MTTSSYTLELFPTEGNYDKVVGWFGGRTEIHNTEENAGVDMFVSKTYTIEPTRKVTLLDLGVKSRMSCNGKPCHFWLAPRSSIWKSGVTQANSIGVIDSSYRGTLMGAVLPFTDQVKVIDEGTRLFQILAPDMGYIEKVVIRPESEIDITKRGEGGFGSTGK